MTSAAVVKGSGDPGFSTGVSLPVNESSVCACVCVHVCVHVCVCMCVCVYVCLELRKKQIRELKNKNKRVGHCFSAVLRAGHLA